MYFSKKQSENYRTGITFYSLQQKFAKMEVEFNKMLRYKAFCVGKSAKCFPMVCGTDARLIR